MNLNKIILNDWQSFRGEHTVNIPTGLVRVTGLNRDNQGANSNRSGKTSLLNAIVGALYNKTPLVATTSKLINRRANYGSVGVYFNNNSGIIRHLKHPKHGNNVFLNEKQITQDELERFLGMGFDAFVSTIFFGTNYSDFLEKILRKPADAKELLTSLLPDLKIFDNAWEWTKKRIKECEENLQNIGLESMELQGKISSLEDINYGSKIEEWENVRITKIASVTKDIIILQNQLSLISSLPKLKPDLQFSTLEKEEQKINLSLQKAQSLLNKNIYQFKSLKDEKQRIGKDLESFEKGICPTCGQKLPSTHSLVESKKLRLSFIKKEIQTITININEEQETINLHSDNLKELQSRRQELIPQINQINKYNQLQSSINQKEETLKQLQKEVNPWVSEQTKTQKNIVQHKVDIIKLQQETIDINNLLKYYNALYTAFGPRGVKNFVFDEIVFRLTDIAQDYLDYMTEGTIQIRFDPRKQKKTGGFTENIGLEIYNETGSGDFFTWSQGERKRIGLATSLAMNKLLREMFSSRFEFLIFDESFDGLDEIGIESFCKLLRTMLNEIKTILVVSHNPYAEDQFDHTIEIIKENGCSSIQEKKLLRRR